MTLPKIAQQIRCMTLNTTRTPLRAFSKGPALLCKNPAPISVWTLNEHHLMHSFVITFAIKPSCRFWFPLIFVSIKRQTLHFRKILQKKKGVKSKPEHWIYPLQRLASEAQWCKGETVDEREVLSAGLESLQRIESMKSQGICSRDMFLANSLNSWDFFCLLT